MPGLHVDRRFQLGFRFSAKNTRRAFQQLVAPLLDLVRVEVEILCQLDQGLLALDRRHCKFSLECRAVVPAWSSCHGHLLARGDHAAVARKVHLSQLFSFPEPPLALQRLQHNARLEGCVMIPAFRHILISSSWGSADFRS